MNRHIDDPSSPTKQVTYVLLVFGSWLGFTYAPGLGFAFGSVGSILIITFAALRWRGRFASQLGLKADRRLLRTAATVLVVLTFWMNRWITQIADEQGVLVISYLFESGFRKWCFNTFTQTLNEEMVVGAVLLGIFVRHLPRWNHATISVVIAAAFAALHFLMYEWNPHHGSTGLSSAALVSLFGVGVLRNVLILESGSIYLAWAVHLAWNLTFFCSAMYTVDGGRLLNEPERFNLILANPTLVASSLIAGAIAIIYSLRSERINPERPNPHP